MNKRQNEIAEGVKEVLKKILNPSQGLLFLAHGQRELTADTLILILQ